MTPGRWFSTTLLVCVLCGLAGSATPSRADTLADVLERFDKVQNSYRTLSAEFTETTESSLLKEPIVAKGRLYLTKPDSVRWEYSSPEPMRFVIAANQYTGYFPRQKRAEKRDIHRFSEQLFRFLGVGQPSTELVEFYDIHLEPSSGDRAQNYVLALEPKKKRVRKRMDRVLLSVDRTSLLPVRVEYTGSAGTSRVIDFDRMQLNPDLSASLYSVEIPPGVKVTTGFSALSGFAPSPKD